jgi:hypothetical protein
MCLMPTWSDLLDRASTILSSFASHTFEAAKSGLLALSQVIGLKPELIAAGVGGFVIFVVVLRLGLAIK